MKIRQMAASIFKPKSKTIQVAPYEFGSPVPAPPEVKRKTIFDYARINNIDILIETGTFRGDTVQSALPLFNKIYSIELNKTLADSARARFMKEPKVQILQGDSAIVLREVLNDLNRPAVFWLDGHYSGGVTAKGEKDTPILEELKCVLSHSIKNHIVLIDDARCFIGEFDYPTLFDIYELVKGVDRNYKVNVKDDIIRIGYAI